MSDVNARKRAGCLIGRANVAARKAARKDPDPSLATDGMRDLLVKLRDAANRDRLAEIAMAKAEAPTATIYRGGWP